MIVPGGQSIDEAIRPYSILSSKPTLTVSIDGLALGWTGEDGDVWIPGHLSFDDARASVLLTDLEELGLYETATTLDVEPIEESDVSHSWWLTRDDDVMIRVDAGTAGAEPYTQVRR